MSAALPMPAELASCSDLASALELILKFHAADSCTIHLLDADGLLHLAASRGLPENVREKLRTLPVGKGIAGLAVERRHPVNLCELPAGGFGDPRPVTRLPKEAALALPLFRGEAVIGALGIGVREERNFSDVEVDQLLQAGRLLATKFIGSMRSTAA